jgi:hypothetical protein
LIPKFAKSKPHSCELRIRDTGADEAATVW